jgi:D-inositol-3-phosphate glycosyltransferase
LKIIILGPAFPLRGGIADFNEALADSLQNAGDDVTIYSFSYQYPSILFPGKSQKAAGLEPLHLKIKSTLSSVNPASWYQTSKLIANEKPDLVIIRYWLPFMAPALGTVARNLRKNKIKIIAITDNVIPHEKRPGDTMLTKYFVKQCDGFIAMSKSVLNDLEKFTTNKNKRFLPHPVYDIFGEKISKTDARNNLALNADNRFILFFGFIREYKGLGILLDAMSQESMRIRKIKLLIAGEFYEDEKPYIEKIKSLKLEENIHLHAQYIGKEKVKDYFCAADLIVQPYLHATQSGITQIAYHFGRPMLVTNVGGLSEIVTNGRVGYVVEKNPEAIANAITDFYDKEREKEFSKNVDIDKEKFTWQSFINRLKDLYREI